MPDARTVVVRVGETPAENVKLYTPNVDADAAVNVAYIYVGHATPENVILRGFTVVQAAATSFLMPQFDYQPFLVR